MKKMMVLIAVLFAALPLFAANQRVYQDATRLAAILQDVQNPNANLSPEAWKRVANEAHSLALHNFTGAPSKASRQARAHVKQMRAAAESGDAAAARMHASEALPFVFEVIRETAPSS
jgi:uncharacterized protein YukE